MKFHRVSDEEYERCKQAGADAHKRGRRAGDCPYRGKTPRVQRLARAWHAGWAIAESTRLDGPQCS